MIPVPRFLSRRGARSRAIRAGVLLAALCASLFSPVPVRAQMDAGSLRVLVLDQSAGVMPGASLTLTNANTGATQTAVTDDAGYVNFTPLPRGTYDLRAELTGFRTQDVKTIAIDVQERKFLRVTLDTAELNEAIEVTAVRQSLQTEEGSLGQVIQGKIAVELPLAGRRYTELALLVPGATPSTMTLDTRGPGWFLVNGNSRHRTTSCSTGSTTTRAR